MLHVTDVRPAGGYRLWLRFNDGFEGEVDLSAELDGPIFMPLKDPALFCLVHIDPDVQTIAWPNGADFAPEFLRGLVAQRTAA
jgi:hypothetical protein